MSAPIPIPTDYQLSTVRVAHVIPEPRRRTVKAWRACAGDAFKRNDWNTYRITCIGKKLTIVVNGVITTDVEDDADASGHLGIQHHGDKGCKVPLSQPADQRDEAIGIVIIPCILRWHG